ncbi:coiled-coil domain-containing protein 22, partial [Ligilactobacillus salivarius]|uniref:coiled-coil domain-containing protein 22 n=2 Tax=Ligilactobacillus salivarius TaxID=1624 RepID=UPI0013708FC6
NATTVKPVDSNGVGLYDPTWNETTNSWDSLTGEEWKKKYIVPEVKPEPTQEEQAAAQQMLLMADLQNKVDTLTDTVDEMTKSNQQINATLAQIMLQNATNAENGGK